MSFDLNRPPQFSYIESFTRPFPHFISPLALSNHSGGLVLDWLETDAPWKLVTADFYEQYEFSFWDVDLPPSICFLQDHQFLDAIKKQVEEQFEIGLLSNFDFTAHKLIAGQTIRVHNDFIPDRETHRLLIQLNRKWADQDGGFLLFFDSAEPSDVSKIIRPTHNSAVAFEISRESHHAVSTIYSGNRYTLVFSFYAKR